MAAESEPASHPGVWSTWRHSPRPVKTILVGVLLSKLGGFLNIFIVLYLTSKGYSPERAALALSVYGAGSVLGSLVGGALALRLGARHSTVISMLATAVLTVSLLYLPNYPLLLLAIVVLSVAAQLYRPAATTLMSELIPKGQQVMIFALYRFALNVGTTGAPLIGFALYYLNHQNYLLLFWAEGIISLLYAVLALTTIPSRAQHAATAASAPQVSTMAGYRAMLRDRRYLIYLLATIINMAIFTQYMSTLPLDVKASGVPIFWYTFALSLNSLLVVTCEIPLTKIVQKWPIQIPIGLMFILVGLGMATYGLPLGPAVIIGGTLIWTVGEVLGSPSVLAYPAIAGPDELRSSYIASFQFVFAAGTAIGPALGAALFVHIGHKVWWTLIPASAVAAYLAVTAIRVPVRTAADSSRPAGPS
jgi:MFS family permease